MPFSISRKQATVVARACFRAPFSVEGRAPSILLCDVNCESMLGSYPPISLESIRYLVESQPRSKPNLFHFRMRLEQLFKTRDKIRLDKLTVKLTMAFLLCT